ncbi:nucleotide exchange factor GrpE [Aliagarivorans marinus]|uniref:nucleotide exchange factor GrpE n=1 Tax=Aliagarivorans marinus TaxID=561965 RepID=UPI0004222F69|nr:nucleotide exchange factor GrpE [Aliagarivorans marinus]
MSSEQNKPQVEEEQVVEQATPDVEAAEEQAQAAAADLDAQESVETEQTEEAQEISIAELIEQLAAAQAKVEEQKDSVVRAKAEMENVRRRAAQDVEKAHKFALEKFANELLPVIDNMELALQHADHDNQDLKPMIEGVELTLKTLISAVEKFGVEVVDPKDETFDPAKHQAMGMQEVEGVAANTVIAVMQKGYQLNGRLIRPAMVMISKAPSVDTTA